MYGKGAGFPTHFIGAFQALPGETAKDAAERVKAYEKQWSGVKHSIEVKPDTHDNDCELSISDFPSRL